MGVERAAIRVLVLALGLGLAACPAARPESPLQDLANGLVAPAIADVTSRVDELAPVGHLLLRYGPACGQLLAGNAEELPAAEVAALKVSDLRTQGADLVPLLRGAKLTDVAQAKAQQGCRALLGARRLLAGAVPALESVFTRFPLQQHGEAAKGLHTAALTLLAGVRGAEAAERLVAITRAGDEIHVSTQLVAVRLLGELSATAAVPRLVELAGLMQPDGLTDGQVRPDYPCSRDRLLAWRGHAILAMGQIPDRRLIDPLLDALDDPCPEIRRLAAESLRKVHVATRP